MTSFFRLNPRIMILPESLPQELGIDGKSLAEVATMDTSKKDSLHAKARDLAKLMAAADPETAIGTVRQLVDRVSEEEEVPPMACGEVVRLHSDVRGYPAGDQVPLAKILLRENQYPTTETLLARLNELWRDLIAYTRHNFAHLTES